MTPPPIPRVINHDKFKLYKYIGYLNRATHASLESMPMNRSILICQQGRSNDCSGGFAAPNNSMVKILRWICLFWTLDRALPKKDTGLPKTPPKKVTFARTNLRKQNSNQKNKSSKNHYNFSSGPTSDFSGCLEGKFLYLCFKPTGFYGFFTACSSHPWATPTAQARGVQPQLSRESTEAPAFASREAKGPAGLDGFIFMGI